MPRIPRAPIRATFAQADIRRPGQSAADHRREKGRVLGDVGGNVLGRVPGVEVARRNIVNIAGTEGVDILFGYRRRPEGLDHRETPFLVE
jgi:hypothetical protein